jgi:hypothetical protein
MDVRRKKINFNSSQQRRLRRESCVDHNYNNKKCRPAPAAAVKYKKVLAESQIWNQSEKGLYSKKQHRC